jgi:protein arginine kinase
MTSYEAGRRVRGMVIEAAEAVEELRGSLVVELEKVSELDRQFLVERHIISRELSPEYLGAVLIGPREVVSLMINEEDHLRIQVLKSGFSLPESWGRADRIDSGLERKLVYEFSPRLGYLTACPTNVGTGMRASLMAHLPALVLSGRINQVFQALSKLGLAVRGIYGEGTKSFGSIFQISNQVTLGKTEEEIIGELEKIMGKIIAHERASRRVLLQSANPQLEDKIYRARGLLENARLISSQETIELLSGLRLGVDLGVVRDIARGTINELLIHTQPAHLQKLVGKELSSPERDLLRAKIIREKLANSPEPAAEKKKSGTTT